LVCLSTLFQFHKLHISQWLVYRDRSNGQDMKGRYRLSLRYSSNIGMYRLSEDIRIYIAGSKLPDLNTRISEYVAAVGMFAAQRSQSVMFI
jgi:hypothetical protein